jgi:hypothetical protein
MEEQLILLEIVDRVLISIYLNFNAIYDVCLFFYDYNNFKWYRYYF